MTNQRQINELVDQMANQRQANLGAADEDHVSTQVATGSDQARAMAALANELGDPLEMDGTVEIQNPMKVWQQAQNALSASRAAENAPAQPSAPAAADDYDEDDDWDDDFAATEVVSAGALNFPFAPPAGGAAPNPPAPSPAGFGGAPQVQTQAPAPPTPAFAPPAQPTPPAQPSPPAQPPASNSGGFDNSAYGSGQFAPNTPPGGRNTNESWGAAAQQQQAPAVGGGFQRSPSGLTSAALFDDDDHGPPMGAPAPVPNIPAGPPVAAPVAPDAGLAEGGGGDVDHPGPWKLKTNFGLTYEFPDTRGLRSWLSSREELDGYTVSSDDGASFLPLADFPQLTRGAGRQAMPSGSRPAASPYGSGLNQNPTGSGQFIDPTQGPPGDPYQSGFNRDPGANPTGGVKGPKVNAEYRPPSRESQNRGLLWFVFLILLVIAVAVGLETFGIFKLSDVARDLGILPKEAPVTAPQKPKSNDKVEAQPVVDAAALAKQQDAEAEKFLKDARRLIKNNKLPAALEKLETTEKVAPENAEVHELMADVYDKLGQAEKAATSRTKAEELRKARNPEGEEGAEGEGEDSATEGTPPPEGEKPGSDDKPK